MGTHYYQGRNRLREPFNLNRLVRSPRSFYKLISFHSAPAYKQTLAAFLTVLLKTKMFRCH